MANDLEEVNRVTVAALKRMKQENTYLKVNERHLPKPLVLELIKDIDRDMQLRAVKTAIINRVAREVSPQLAREVIGMLDTKVLAEAVSKQIINDIANSLKGFFSEYKEY